jgi:hypothetical protein
MRRVEVEQDGQVRVHGAAGESIRRRNERAIQTTTARLIGYGGIDETVAEHKGPLGELGPDDLADELGATGGEEERLSGDF